MKQLNIELEDEEYLAVLKRKLELGLTYREIVLQALDIDLARERKVGRPSLEDQQQLVDTMPATMGDPLARDVSKGRRTSDASEKHPLDGIYERERKKALANFDGISPEEVEDPSESEGLDGIYPREQKKWKKRM
jgi:hypothetical protein